MTILAYITPKDFVRLDHKNAYKLLMIILLGLCEKEKYMRVWGGVGWGGVGCGGGTHFIY
jgi:hypothetical protein